MARCSALPVRRLVDRAVMGRGVEHLGRGRGPCSFARYIAASALRSSVSGVSLSPPDSAMPIARGHEHLALDERDRAATIASDQPLGDELGGLLAR